MAAASHSSARVHRQGARHGDAPAPRCSPAPRLVFRARAMRRLPLPLAPPEPDDGGGRPSGACAEPLPRPRQADRGPPGTRRGPPSARRPGRRLGPRGAGSLPERWGARRRVSARSCPVSSPAPCIVAASRLCQPEVAWVRYPRALQGASGPRVSLNLFVMLRSSGLTSQFKDHRFFGSSSDFLSSVGKTNKHPASGAPLTGDSSYLLPQGPD